MTQSITLTRLISKTTSKAAPHAYLSRSYPLHWRHIRRHVATLCKMDTCTSLFNNNPIADSNLNKFHQPLTFVSRLQRSRSHKRYVSSLYISDKISKNSSFEYDLENLLREPEMLKENVRTRGLDIDIDGLVQDHKMLVELKQQRESLKNTQASIAQKYKEVKLAAPSSMTEEARELLLQELVAKGKEVKSAVSAVMSRLYEVEDRMMLTALKLPNNTDPVVSEDQLNVIETFNTDQMPDCTVHHIDVMKDRKWVKYCNLGPRSYFLTGRLAILEQELIRTFLTALRDRGFIQLSSPDMFKAPVVESAGVDFDDKTQVYRVDGKPTEFIQDSLFLHGSSAMSFLSFFARMIIQKDHLPLKLFNIGHNYIPDNDVSSRLPGLYGALQSMKVDVCGICKSPEESQLVFQQFQSMLVDIYKYFKLPFRLASLPVTSLRVSEQNRVELQLWIPSLQQYLKIAAVSSLGTYSSRRLMIRYPVGDRKSKTLPVHTVHAEVTDITRLIAVLVEYGLTDGIPDL